MYNTRSCPFLVPPPLFNVEISSVLNGRPMENCYATFAGDSSVESRPTLIKGKGNLVVFKITLCPSLHNLNFGKIKQYAIWQIKLQTWTGERNFPQSKWKGKKRNSKKNTAKVCRSKVYSVGMEAITSTKTPIYKEKTSTIFETAKWKKKRAVGRRNPGPNHWITP